MNKTVITVAWSPPSFRSYAIISYGVVFMLVANLLSKRDVYVDFLKGRDLSFDEWISVALWAFMLLVAILGAIKQKVMSQGIMRVRNDQEYRINTGLLGSRWRPLGDLQWEIDVYRKRFRVWDGSRRVLNIPNSKVEIYWTLLNKYTKERLS